MKFSERYGYKPVRELIQIDSMDGALRNSLWNLLDMFLWRNVKVDHSTMTGTAYISTYGNEEFKLFLHRLWFVFFKKPLDTQPSDWSRLLKELRTHFFDCEWYGAYDFIEFVANNYKETKFSDRFPRACNRVFEKELSAYRFVDGTLTRITDEHEAEEVELAIQKARGPVSTHIRRSLELLSSREKPDYRNSIKEAISAVESLVKEKLGEEKGTLGQLLKVLGEDIGLHAALVSAFSKLYGYTSDESGIRHALTENDKLDFHDAKFMLVTCSAFVNFVEGKFQDSREI